MSSHGGGHLYMQTNEVKNAIIHYHRSAFPDGTIFFEELQLTLPPAENPDGSKTQPSGRGHIENGAKKDEVWTQFYRLLDK